MWVNSFWQAFEKLKPVTLFCNSTSWKGQWDNECTLLFWTAAARKTSIPTSTSYHCWGVGRQLEKMNRGQWVEFVCYRHSPALFTQQPLAGCTCQIRMAQSNPKLLDCPEHSSSWQLREPPQDIYPLPRGKGTGQAGGLLTLQGLLCKVAWCVRHSM